MNIYSYLDYRQFIRDRVDGLRSGNVNLSIREVLRRVRCSSPSYYKEVIVDAKKKMSIATGRRFADFFRLSGDETDYFLLLIQYNQAKTEIEKLHFYKQLLHFTKKPATDDHFLNINEYGYMAEWQNAVIRELLPLADDFGNRNPDEREALAQLLRMKVTDRQIDEAIRLLDALKFIRKNAKGSYRKTGSTIRAEKKTPAAFRALCQFMDLGKSIINTTDPRYRLFKVAILGMNKETFTILEKKIDEACREMITIAGASVPHIDRLYAMNIQFFPLTKLPEEGSG
ncbi:MAG: TIGR02147 family protein [Chitinispirillaceae bacterium]|nr:TIGR02147 family protein [Chitinispirillaceae bacterium]